jgi:hypothetical protein
MAAKKFKAEMVAFASEAWMSNRERGYQRAGQDPERREVIIINLECNNLFYIDESFTIEIETGPSGKILKNPDQPTPLQGLRGWNYGVLKAAIALPDFKF